MVRTRSGKATTRAEKKETQEIKPSPKSSPKKASKRSPKKAGKLQPGWQYDLLMDLCPWKPTEKTFTFWSCLAGLNILVIAGYSVYLSLGTKYTDSYFFAIILGIHCFDILSNFCNELFGNGHLNDVIIFTESAVNVSEAFLVLFMMDQASNLIITAVVMMTFNILALNIKFMNDEKIWIRLATYSVLMACFAFNYYQNVMTDIRITAYVGLVFVSMIVDTFDFPDKYFNLIPMCEGIVIFARSLGIYMLITADLVSGTSNGFTTIEYIIKSWIGM